MRKHGSRESRIVCLCAEVDQLAKDVELIFLNSIVELDMHFGVRAVQRDIHEEDVLGVTLEDTPIRRLSNVRVLQQCK
jgi:hypothetical protein